ncbi:MAG: T9SS type A sorting domain-containing protein [Lentimicrobiaceae bacterium]|nr:T9SS type A sorting domain-containing protein [Lentimicrobiaceae bacterium]
METNYALNVSGNARKGSVVANPEGCCRNPKLAGKRSHLAMALLLVSFLLFSGMQPLFALSYTSSGSGDWNNAATWGGSGVPVAGDDVTIASNHAITVTANAACASIVFNNDGASLVVNNGVTLTVSGSIYLQALYTVNRSATITGGGTVLAGSVQVGGQPSGLPITSGFKTTNLYSTVNTFTITGNLTIVSYGTIGDKNEGYFNLESGTVTVGGTVALNTSPAGNDLTRPRSTLTMETGAQSGTLILTGATPFTKTGNIYANFYANGTTATVDYAGANQTVYATPYRNLILSNSGTKTLTSVNTINGDLEFAGTAAATAALAMTIGDDVTLGATASFNAGTFTHRVGGDWFNNGGTFTAGTSKFVFNGTAAQTLGGSAASSFYKLELDNAAGLVLATNQSISDSLIFKAGIIGTGANVLSVLASPVKVSGEGSTGYVNGNLLFNIPTGSSVSRMYFIGDATAYTPVTVLFASVGTAGTLTGSTTSGDHPNIATSGIDPAKSVNRYWTFTQSGLAFTTYDITFNYVSADIDGGANTSNFILNSFTPWTLLTTGTLTATSSQATGVASFSDFQVGECLVPVAFNVTGGGDYCDGGAGVAVGVDSSQVGVDYILNLNGTPVDTVSGTGNPFSFGNQTTGGTYTVVGLRVLGGCTNNMAGNAVVVVNENPSASVLSVSGDTCICSGNSSALAVAITGGASPYFVVYNDGTLNDTVLGYVSGNNITVTLSTTTSFTLVNVVDSNGCVSGGLSGNPSIEVDVLDPVIVCPADTTIDCHTSTDPAATGSATATDNCDGNPTITYADNVTPGACPNEWTITRRWKATDVCGNVDSCDQVITVQDTTKPTFTVPGDTTLYRDASCTIDTTTADIGDVTDEADNCATGLQATYVDNVAGLAGCNGTGTFTRTWTLTDSCGNATVKVQTVTVLDTLKPTFTVPNDTTLYRDASCSIDTLTTDIGDVTDEADNCSSGLDATYVDNVAGLSGCNSTGSFTRTWTLVDDCGNTTVKVQTITVLDTLKPTFTVPNDTTLYRDATCTIDTTTADIGDVTDEADNCSTGLDATYVDNVTGLSLCNSTGSFTRTWTLVDDCGNTTVKVQTITVLDTLKPTFTVPNDTTLYRDATCTIDTTTADIGDVTDEADNCSTGLDATYVDNVTGLSGCNSTGSFTRTWTLVDDCGNTTVKVQTITVLDTLKPTFTVPNDTTLYRDASCSIDTLTTDIGDVTDEADNCSTGLDATYVDNVAGLSLCNSTGSFTRTWTLVDDCGNTTVKVQTITVLDTLKPTFTVPNDTTLYRDATCTIDTTTADIGDVTDEADNCSTGLDATYVDDVTGLSGCNSTGSFTRTWTLVDDCGNTTVKVQTITVLDTIKPTFTRPIDITIYANASCVYDASTGVTGDVTDEDDNCTVTLNATYTDDTTAGSCQGSWIIERTWSLEDDCGNKAADQIQTITVEDTISPTFTRPVDITIYTDASCVYDAGISKTGDVTDEADNCTTTLDATFTDDTTAGSCEGEWVIERTWRLEDDCGNVTTQIQTITVEDTIKPTFTRPADTTIYTNASCLYDASVAYTGDVTDEADNCTTSLNATFTDDTTAGSCEGSWIIERTWSLVDDCGNAAPDQIQTITVLDTIKPTFTRPIDITIYTTASCTYDATVSATGDVTDEADNCTTVLDATFTDDTTAGTCEGSWIIERTWSLEDDCGNKAADQIQTITVLDTTKPTFTRPVDLNIYTDANCAYDASITFTGDVTDEADNCTTTLDATFTDDTTAGSCEGSWVIERTWRLEDDCGNVRTDMQTITVLDTIKPTFTRPADTTIYTDANCLYDASVTFTGDVTDEADNCTTTLDATFTDDTTAGSCEGAWIIERTWSLVDDCGNAAPDQIQTITVEDTIKPTFTRPVDITIYTNASCVYDASVSATGDVTDEADNCTTVLDATFTDDTTAGTCEGSWIIERTWSLEDDCGNKAADQIQTITVEDTTKPTFTRPVDITVYTDANCQYNASIAVTGDVTDEADNCTAILEATYSDDTTAGSCEGSWIIERTWSLEDDCGNKAADQIQTITVEDSTKPTFTRPVDITIYTDATCTYDAGVSATGDVTDEADNCTTTLDATFTDDTTAGSCEGSWVIERTWSLVDDCGNAAPDQIQTITVEDTIKPTFTRPVDITIYATASCTFDASLSATGEVTDADDNCTTLLEATYSDDTTAGSCQGQWIIERTWSLQDACGNQAADQVQVITVLDTLPPTFTRPVDITIYADIDCLYDADPSITGDVTDEDDNCSTGLDATYSDVITPGLCEGSWVIERTWSLVDDCGNAAEDQVQTIEIEDTIVPTAVAPADTSIECSTWADCDVSGFFNCFDPSLWTQNPGDGIILHTNTFALMVSADSVNIGTPDTSTLCINAPANGTIVFRWIYNTFDADQQVRFDPFGYSIDNIYYELTDPFTANQSGVATVNISAGSEFCFVQATSDQLLDFAVTITGDFLFSQSGIPTGLDNCTDASFAFTDNPVAGTCEGEQTITRTWVALDGCGNVSATDDQIIQITDTTAPTFTKPADITIYTDASCLYDASIGVTGDVTDENDNCTTGQLDALYSDDTLKGSCQGSWIIERTWSLEDDCGNAAADQVQIITILDTLIPSFTRPADITIYSDASCLFDADVTATGDVTDEADNCATGIQATFADDTIAGSCEGAWIIERTWSLVDSCGNAAADQMQTITVLDTLKPTANVPTPDSVCLEALPPVDISVVTGVADNCTANPTVAFVSENTVGFNPAILTRTYSVTDDCGNSITVDHVITILNTYPGVTCHSDTSVCINYPPFKLFGGLPLGGVYSGPGVVNGWFYPVQAGVGIHNVTYTYTDVYGCSNSCVTRITVLDIPIVTCPTSMEACVSDPAFVLAGGLPLGGTYSGPGVNLGQFNPATAGVGTQAVVYTYTASNGCTSACSFTITVHALPVMSCPASQVVCSNDAAFALTGGLPAGGTYSGTGVNAGMFNPATASIGANTITYGYTDANNCYNECTFTITVNAAPVVSCPANMSKCINDPDFALSGGLPAGGTYSGTGITGGIFSPAGAGLGTHTITYTYTDGNNCTASCSFTITVNDLPLVTCPADMTLCLRDYDYPLSGGLPAGGTYSGAGVTGGNFNGAAAGAGTHVITYTYKDGNNCQNSCTFTITVDSLANVECPANVEVCVNDPSFTLPAGNPAGGTYAGTGVSGSTFNPALAGVGTHAIRYTYTDPSICIDTCTFYVTVYGLPVVNCPASFNVCASDAAFALTAATPAGGTYSGTGVSGGMFDPAVAGGGTHVITYAYEDGNGCVGTCSFSISVGPIVNAGPDVTVFIGESHTFSPTASGPGTLQYSWSPALTLNNALIPNATATPIATTVYTLMVVDGGGCSNTDDVEITVLPRGNSISGQVVYDNIHKTPMSGFGVIISSLDKSYRDTVITRPGGLFDLDSIPNGTYVIGGFSNQAWAWGGVNSTDALFVMRHFVQLDTLRGIRLMAGDVNLSGAANTSDALLIGQRFAGLINSFPVQDWLLEPDTVVFTTPMLYSRQHLVLSAGDVNGSHVPTMKNAPLGSLTYQGTVNAPQGKVISLPVQILEDMYPGAVSLQLILPEGIMVKEMRNNPELGGQLAYAQEGNLLNIAWFSLDAPFAVSGTTLFYIDIIAGDIRDEVRLNAGEVLEVATREGQVVKDARLGIPALQGATSEDLVLTAYPNPFSKQTLVSYSLPEQGDVKLEVFNMFGASVAVLIDRKMDKGMHESTFDATTLPTGSYFLKLSVESEGRLSTQVVRLIHTR